MYWNPLVFAVCSGPVVFYAMAFCLRLLFVLFGVLMMEWLSMPVAKRWDVIEQGLVFLFLGPEYDLFSSEYPHPLVPWYCRPFYVLIACK